MGYIGHDLQVAYQSYLTIDDISGSFNGSTTSFALLVNGAAPVPLPLRSNQCLISVGGVVQRPDDSGAEGFRLSGGNIIFSSAPSTGEDFFGVILAGADYVGAGTNFPDGTVGAPSITFDLDNDTGYYRSGSGSVGFASNGVASGSWSSAGVTAPALIPTGSTVPANGTFLPTTNTLGFSTNTTERIRIDSSGRVGIGATPAALLDANGVGRFLSTSPSYPASGKGLEIYYDSSGDLGYLQTYDRGASAWKPVVLGGSAVRFNISGNEAARIDSSSRLLVGTTSYAANSNFAVAGYNGLATGQGVIDVVLGTTRPTSANTTIGSIRFTSQSVTSSNYHYASIEAASDGASSSDTDIPGRLVFNTTADGASSPTERMRITQAGLIQPALNSLVTYAHSTASPATVTLPDQHAQWELSIYAARNSGGGYGTRYQVYHIGALGGYPRSQWSAGTALVSDIGVTQTSSPPGISISSAINGVITITVTGTGIVGWSYSLRQLNIGFGY